MRKWAVSDYHRQLIIDEVFKAGYGSEEELQQHMIRWTKEEMSDQCDDKDLLCLFQRYVTWSPTIPGRDKEEFEKEIEAQIALDELLS